MILSKRFPNPFAGLHCMSQSENWSLATSCRSNSLKGFLRHLCRWCRSNKYLIGVITTWFFNPSFDQVWPLTHFFCFLLGEQWGSNFGSFWNNSPYVIHSIFGPAIAWNCLPWSPTLQHVTQGKILFESPENDPIQISSWIFEKSLILELWKKVCAA